MASQIQVSQIVIEFLVPQAGAPSISISGVPPNGTVGVPYGFCFTVVGGTGPYAWAVDFGATPPGTSLDVNTGCITGVPTTAGTFPIKVKVTDADALTATTPLLNITIVAGSLIIQLIGWKLYPMAQCDAPVEGAEIPSVKRAV